MKRVTFYIAKSLKKSINILASTFYSAQSDLISSILILAIPSLFPLSNADISALKILNSNTRMTNIESELGDIKCILNRILAIVSGRMQ